MPDLRPRDASRQRTSSVMWRHSIVAGLAVVTVGLSGGCAAVLAPTVSEVTPLHAIDAREVGPGSIEVSVNPSRQLLDARQRDAVRTYGWLGDLVAGAMLSQAVSYATIPDALTGIAVGALSVAGLDYWFQFSSPMFHALDPFLGKGLQVLLAPVGAPLVALALPFVPVVPSSIRRRVLGTAMGEAERLERLAGGSLVFEDPKVAEGRLGSLVLPPSGAPRVVSRLDELGVGPEQVRIRLSSASGTLLGVGHFTWQGYAAYQEDLARRAEEEQRQAEEESAKRSSMPKLVPVPVLETKVTLQTPHKDNIIWGAKSGSALLVTVANKGKAVADGVVAQIVLPSRVPGLSVPESKDVGRIPPGEERTVEMALGAGRSLTDGTASLEVMARDKTGIDSPTQPVVLTTRAFRLPRFEMDRETVQVVDSDGLVRRGRIVEVVVQVRNVGGWAEDAQVRLLMQAAGLLFPTEGGEKPESNWKRLGKMAPNAVATCSWSVLANHSYKGEDRLPLSVEMRDRQDQARVTLPVTKVVLDRVGDPVNGPKVFDPTGSPTGQSGTEFVTVDVDEPISAPRPTNDSALALIIGIETYAKGKGIPPVPFAERDAERVRQYLRDLMGVRSDRILILKNDNASRSGIEIALSEKLARKVKAGVSDVYVYYAGHGAPDTRSGDPFLVPWDAEANQVRSFLPLRDVYDELSHMKARSVTVMLDSCFSGGAGRTPGGEVLPLLAGRPVGIKETRSIPQGIAVLAATDNGQISSAYQQMRHGLFTYYLLKGLRGGAVPKGKVQATLKDLAQYVQAAVSEKAADLTLPPQQPQLLGDVHDRVLVQP